MQAQLIDREGKINDHFENSKEMTVRQTRKGWLQECLGCEAKAEFRWFQKVDEQNRTEFGTSLEDSGCCLRICCSPCHPFTMTLKELGSDAEILTMDRPCFCPPGGCKCCCFQEMTFSAGGQNLGAVKEQFYCCVPRFVIRDGEDKPLYKLHMPTCFGGFCVNCCTEGNPCGGKGCCKCPFHIFPADQQNTDNGAEPLGKIVKAPKSFGTEIFTEADAFDVVFPDDATPSQKAILAGTSIFLNALYFEENNSNE